MSYIYGKQDWKTIERGEENCYLMTNGLGGFSSLTMIGSASRNDQALLMACLRSPNHRMNMIHRLEESLTIGTDTVKLSSQRSLRAGKQEDGYKYLAGFTFADYPQWIYLVQGVEITKTVILEQGKNVVGVRYDIKNASREEVTLTIKPYLVFALKGALMKENQEFTFEEGQIVSGETTLYYKTNGDVEELPLTYDDSLFYAYDACDGRKETGRAAVNHQIKTSVAAGADFCLDLFYGTEKPVSSIEEIKDGLVTYRKALLERADLSLSGKEKELADVLVLAADQYVSLRESTGGKTILAGFPFFEDWGRDTMIAIRGCCLATKQYETAKSILRTFRAYCKKGLMPNLFPEGKENPGYNTVDAALLFIIAVYEYYQQTKDQAFVMEMYPAMQEIIHWYEKGTEFGIHMDEDGLIMAGEGYDQVTWMDVRVGDILPTPRHGKPVEINAYWYNALCMMEEWRTLAEDPKEYGEMAEKAKKSFQALFWLEEKHCLKDVISGMKVDNQIRCNQIWAVSLPFSLLSREQEMQVVETVYEKLYTPYGLRTLAKEDEEFCAVYGGDQLVRDLSYHQGTVWGFPLGGYYLAYLKVHDYSDEAKKIVSKQLSWLEPALREGCVGQLPEIYDGENPTSSKGCFAQAWSVGELLKVFKALEQ